MLFFESLKMLKNQWMKKGIKKGVKNKVIELEWYLSWNRGVPMASKGGANFRFVFPTHAYFTPMACHCFNSETLLCNNKLTIFINFAFLAVMFLLKAIASFPLSGTIMLTFRLVQPELKSMANAVSALLMSAFGRGKKSFFTKL